MNCAEAQALIRKGVIAGAGPGRNPQLGFHLAGCADCRAFRAAYQVRTPVRYIPRAPRPLPAATPARQRTGIRLRQVATGACALLLLFAGWYYGLRFLRAWSDVTAMTSLDTSTLGEFHNLEAVASAEGVLLIPATLTPGTAGSGTLSSVALVLPTATVAPPTAPASTPTRTPGMLTAGEPLAMVEPTERPTATATETPTTTPLPTDTATPTSPPPTATSPPPTATSPPPTATWTPPTATWTPPTVVPSPVPVIAPSSTPLPLPTTAPVVAVAQPTAVVPVAVAPVQPAAGAAGAVTVLVLGLDARAGEGFLARSDAIMLVRLNPARQTISLLSLPRDLWAPIPGVGEGRINSAYYIGQQYGQGAALAKKTISQAIGIPIDYVVVVNFQGFRQVIDTIGGVPINVPSELYDPEYPTEDYGYMVAHFSPGFEHMNGSRALMYSRIRHTDSDWGRMGRQQQVVLGIVQQLRNRGMLRNLSEADQLTAALRPYLRTDMPPAVALNLLQSMRLDEVGAVQRIIPDASMLSDANIGGAAVMIASPEALYALGARLVAGP